MSLWRGQWISSGRHGGGHSKAACAMSVRPPLRFEALGCQSAGLIRPRWVQRKTSAAHANAFWFRFAQRSCGSWAQTQIMVIPNAHCTGSRRIKSLPADKMTTNGGHSDDLRGGRLLFGDNNQRNRESVCLPDLFIVQTQLRKEQIDAELLTDSYYPNRRMMMGIISRATQTQ